jgi:hypothetical protein
LGLFSTGPVSAKFVLDEVNRVVGTGRNTNAAEIALALIHRGHAIQDGDGILGAGKDAGASAAALLQINNDLGQAETSLSVNSQFAEPPLPDREGGCQKEAG